MQQGVVLVYTHDSIGLGEDGPTHQPVEHVASPAPDAESFAVASLRCARDGRGLGRGHRAPARARPRCAHAPGAAAAAAHARAGHGHRTRRLRADRAATARPRPSSSPPARKWRSPSTAVNALNAAGRRVRLVSMPSTDVFDAQDAAYRESVLPAVDHAPRRHRGRRHRRSGGNTWARRAACSASTASALRARPPISTGTSA